MDNNLKDAHEGSGREIDSKDVDLTLACTPGDMTCINGFWHHCMSDGRWVSTGRSCRPIAEESGPSE